MRSKRMVRIAGMDIPGSVETVLWNEAWYTPGRVKVMAESPGWWLMEVPTERGVDAKDRGLASLEVWLSERLRDAAETRVLPSVAATTSEFEGPVGPVAPVAPVGPVGPVGPVEPWGMTKFNRAFWAVPALLTSALVPGAPVVTLPTSTVAAPPGIPVAPVAPVGPVTP